MAAVLVTKKSFPAGPAHTVALTAAVTVSIERQSIWPVIPADFQPVHLVWSTLMEYCRAAGCNAEAGGARLAVFWHPS